MPTIGLPEIIILLVIVLLIFGPKRLPMLGRQIGGGMREFKNSITSKADDDEVTHGDVADDRQDPNTALGRPELAEGDPPAQVITPDERTEVEPSRREGPAAG